MMTFWRFSPPSILIISERPSHEKYLEDPDPSKSAIKNRVYCYVWYLSIVCSLKGTGLPSGSDISLTGTFFLPHPDTFWHHITLYARIAVFMLVLKFLMLYQRWDGKSLKLLWKILSRQGRRTVTNMLRVSNKRKGTMLHNNIKGKGTALHNNNKVKGQRFIRYTLRVMFYYALTPTYINSYVIPT